jgi:hypothetical protein
LDRLDTVFPNSFTEKIITIPFSSCPRARGKEDRMSTLSDYLKILFNEDELIVSDNKYNSTKQGFSFGETLERLSYLEPSLDGIFVGLNPVKDRYGGYREENISKYRNFLIEIDQVPRIEDQLRIIKLSKIPFSAITFSGNRSLHAVISLEEDLPLDPDAYRDIHKALCLRLGNICDLQTGRPSVTTKVPGSQRVLSEGRISEQKVYYVGTRISSQDFAASISEEFRQVKMINSISKKIEAVSSADCEGDRELLEAYCSSQSNRVSAHGESKVQCPLCASEGGDRSRDNLSINLSREKPLAKCWANEDHRYRDIINQIKCEMEVL